MRQPEIIRPGIIVKDYYGHETTIYPTGLEWVLAFAIKGCDWAIEALPEAIYQHNLRAFDQQI